MTTVMPHVNDPSVVNLLLTLTVLQPCIMKNAVHVHDLGAKVMGSGQSRLCYDVPWQGQSKEPQPPRWLVQKKRLALCKY